MAKSSAPTLYGVKHPNPTSVDGTIKALDWAEKRAPGAWGHMTDEDKARIVWFNDPGARDEFKAMFGGLNVTLHRREERTFEGLDALNLLRRAS